VRYYRRSRKKGQIGVRDRDPALCPPGWVHPFIEATNAVESGTRTLEDVERTEGQRFAEIVRFALSERARQRLNLTGRPRGA